MRFQDAYKVLMGKAALFALLAVAACSLLAAAPAVAHADSMPGGSWTVTYTSGGSLTDDFSAAEFNEAVSTLQPGDDVTFTITMRHENESSADWYLSNEVVKSLEDGAAKGSAYGYELAYAGPSRSRALYESKAMGGDGSRGLLEATDALDDFFFLETLSRGQAGTVTLKVTLDGETWGNDYFETLAKVKMRFAAGTRVGGTTSGSTLGSGGSHRGVVQTGDPTDLLPSYIAMLVSSVLLALLAAQSVRLRKRDRAGAAIAARRH